MTISHITEILSPDDIMTAMFEFTLKNHSRTHRTLMCLPLLPYIVTPITKWTSPLNSHQKTTPEHTEHLCVCCYCHIWSLQSQTDITIEFTLQNQSKTYITLMGWPLLPYMVTPITKRTSLLNSHQKPLRTYITFMGLPLLPYMVTPITKRTSPLNSHQKTTLEHIEHLCVCHYCHIWSLRSQNKHHH